MDPCATLVIACHLVPGVIQPVRRRAPTKGRLFAPAHRPQLHVFAPAPDGPLAQRHRIRMGHGAIEYISHVN